MESNVYGCKHYIRSASHRSTLTEDGARHTVSCIVATNGTSLSCHYNTSGKDGALNIGLTSNEDAHLNIFLETVSRTTVSPNYCVGSRVGFHRRHLSKWYFNIENLGYNH